MGGCKILRYFCPLVFIVFFCDEDVQKVIEVSKLREKDKMRKYLHDASTFGSTYWFKLSTIRHYKGGSVI